MQRDKEERVCEKVPSVNLNRTQMCESENVSNVEATMHRRLDVLGDHVTEKVCFIRCEQLAPGFADSPVK